VGTKTTDVRVKIGADYAEFDLAMKSAATSARVFERELAKLEAAQRQMALAEGAAYREEGARNAKRETDLRHMGALQMQAMREEETRNKTRAESIGKVGSAFMVSGAVIGIGLGLATKAAVDWQDSFAGVEKVVSGSLGGLSEKAKETTLGALGQQLRDLSKSIPDTVEGIDAVAASAGQLGVGIPDLAKFTSVAEQLGATTTMSADDAATGLAKLGNVMGVLPADVDRAGSALLALGNFGASTEQQILDMSVRIAGAGKVVGLTEPQVMGFANALTSVGINAEEGGSAISRVFIEMATAVKDGGKNLDGFARVSGMSAKQFATAFGADASGAMTSFLSGLHQINAQGGDTFGTLDKLHLSEIRVRDTLLRASAASGLLTDSLTLGSKAWRDNNALLEAAAVKYGTDASKMQIARNNINDAAITIGQRFLPALAGAADKVAVLARGFGSLPGPAKSAVGVLGALGASALIAGGAAMSLVPKVHTLLTTLDAIGGVGGKAATGLRAAGSALMGPLGIALAAGTIALGYWVNKEAEAKQGVDEMTTSLDQQTGAVTESSRAIAAHQMIEDGTTAAARKLGIDLSTLTDAALGNADAQERVNRALMDQKSIVDSMDTKKGASEPGTGDVVDTSAAIKKVRDAVSGQNDQLEQSKRKWQDTHDAMGAAATQADTTAGATDGLGGKVDDLSGGLQSAKDQLTAFSKALKALYDQEFAVEAAQDSFDKSLNDLATSQENAAKGTTKATAADRAAATVAGDKAKQAALAAGETSKQATAAAKTARDQSLANVSHKQSTAELANTQIALRGSLRGIVQDGYDLIESMAKQGASSDQLKTKAKELADKLEAAGTKAHVSKKTIEEYTGALLAVPGQVSTSFATPGLQQATAAVQTLIDRIALVNGKQVSIKVDASAANVREDRTAGGVTKPQPSQATPTPNVPQTRAHAWGGIDTYAAGGEDHVAQIARPGDNRMWAEPETGGEAYIPLSPAKRGRSQAILGDVARRFGGQVSYGSQPHIQIVKVPVQQTHTTLSPINVGTIVTESPAAFVDWTSTQRAFSSARQA
jgi:TP901 family phage tail tape measure protein